MDGTRYATVGPLHVAYQRFGTGDLDLVLVADWFSNVEQMWEGAAYRQALGRLGSFARVLVFDKRGVGLSDPLPLGADGLPTMEEWIADLEAVMDDAEIKSAALMGVGAGGAMVLQFAASHPHRADAVVLVNSYARLARADDYPAGVPERVKAALLAQSYTDEGIAAGLSGSSGDVATRTWWQRYQRQSVSPGVAAAMRAMLFEVDVRSVLPSVQAPALVVHRAEDPWVRVAHGRHLAEHLRDARLVVLPGDEDLFFVGDVDRLLDEVERFLTDAPPVAPSDRVLAAILFTDLVDSTAAGARVGDARWRVVLDEHDRVVAGCVEQQRGRVVKGMGDGVLAVFDGPGRAIRAAGEIKARLTDIGLDVRCGVHAGEIESRGDDVAGIAVAIAARVSALGGAGDVLATSTVRDLVAGSGIGFVSRGRHVLKGVPGEWDVVAVAAPA